jgi:hypothetical protein
MHFESLLLKFFARFFAVSSRLRSPGDAELAAVLVAAEISALCEALRFVRALRL